MIVPLESTVTTDVSSERQTAGRGGIVKWRASRMRSGAARCSSSPSTNTLSPLTSTLLTRWRTVSWARATRSPTSAEMVVVPGCRATTRPAANGLRDERIVAAPVNRGAHQRRSVAVGNGGGEPERVADRGRGVVGRGERHPADAQRSHREDLRRRRTDEPVRAPELEDGDDRRDRGYDGRDDLHGQTDVVPAEDRSHTRVRRRGGGSGHGRASGCPGGGSPRRAGLCAASHRRGLVHQAKLVRAGRKGGAARGGSFAEAPEPCRAPLPGGGRRHRQRTGTELSDCEGGASGRTFRLTRERAGYGTARARQAIPDGGHDAESIRPGAQQLVARRWGVDRRVQRLGLGGARPPCLPPRAQHLARRRRDRRAGGRPGGGPRARLRTSQSGDCRNARSADRRAA